MWWYHVVPGWSLLLLPLVVTVLVLFTAASALMLAMGNLFYRDVKYLFEIVIAVWMFATSVVYPIGRVGGRLGAVLALNPMTHIIVSYQEILFFTGPIGHWKWLLATGAASVALFLAGFWLFDRLRDSFAESV